MKSIYKIHHIKIIPAYFVLLILITLTILNEIRIFYIPINIPGRQMAITIPPLGIFIEDQFKNEPNIPCSILNHEKVHWEQFRKMGLVSFYFNYFKSYFKSGRIINWMEEEARNPCKTGKLITTY
jgi:hypothetical protein